MWVVKLSNLSYQKALGLSLGEIGHLLGHRSVSQTRRYAHLVESRSIEAVSKMTEQVFQGVENG